MNEFENVRISETRNQRLKNIATAIEMELLDIIMKEYEKLGMKEIPSIGLALGIYSITMQFTSEIQKHTLHLMVKAQGENERVPTTWRYEKE